MMLDQQAQTELSIKQRQTQYTILPQIVIFDDDDELLDELKDALSLNYEVEAFSDSANAFDIICKLKPDLIITDMKMSPKTGFQLAYELKKFEGTKSIPIIAITGVFVEKEHTLMMKLSGIKRIIIKPFDSDQLIEEIDSVLKEFKPRWV